MSVVADQVNAPGGPGTALAPHARPAGGSPAVTPWDALVQAHDARDSLRHRQDAALAALALGWPAKAVALAVEVTPTTIYRWARAAEEGAAHA